MARHLCENCTRFVQVKAKEYGTLHETCLFFKKAFRLPVNECDAYDRKMIIHMDTRDAWHPVQSPSGEIRFFSPNAPPHEVWLWQHQGLFEAPKVRNPRVRAGLTPDAGEPKEDEEEMEEDE